MTDQIKRFDKKYDISVILNCHNESIYVISTLKSLEISIQKAAEKGISVELIIVLDKPSEEIKSTIGMFRFPDFFRLKTIEVSNGSLGLSRNDGIRAAEGKFIYLCDADDLVSSNSIIDSYWEANNYFKINKKHSCFVPQFVYTFGNRKNLTELYDSRYFSPSDLVFCHPFCSRIFFHYSLFENRSFKDLRKETGFAYEDWEFNSELIADAIEILPVKDTILFYRKRSGSIMSSGDFVKLPQLERLGEVSVFYRLNRTFKRPHDVQEKLLEDPLEKLKNSRKLLSYLRESANIDPTLDIDTVRESFNAIGKNLDCIGPHWGNLLALLLRLTGWLNYDDIYLLPWLKAGGGEKYILQILSSILLANPEKKALVITLERTDLNKWIDKLPENCIFLNFEKLTRNVQECDKKLLLFRLLLSISYLNRTNLHVKTGIFANSFLNEFGDALSKNLNIYRYLFCLTCKNIKGQTVINPLDIEMVRDQIRYTHRFINDNEKLTSFFVSLLGEHFREKFLTVYAYVSDKGKKINYGGRGGSKKILWASRICNQKRPEILNCLAKKLESSNSDCRIDVYGPIENNLNIKFNDFLVYKGEFSSFETIDLSSYSAFLYTSWFDGIPNIILEAASIGLPVIAPIGPFSAIEEVINNETGWPVLHSDCDEEMAERYFYKIEEFFKNQNEAIQKATNLSVLLSKQYSFGNHLENTKKEFGNKKNNITDLQIDMGNHYKIIYNAYKNLESNKTERCNYSYNLFDNNTVLINEKTLRQKIIEFETSDAVKNNVTSFMKIKARLSTMPILYKILRKIYRIPKVKSCVNKFFLNRSQY